MLQTFCSSFPEEKKNQLLLLTFEHCIDIQATHRERERGIFFCKKHFKRLRLIYTYHIRISSENGYLMSAITLVLPITEVYLDSTPALEDSKEIKSKEIKTMTSL